MISSSFKVVPGSEPGQIEEQESKSYGSSRDQQSPGGSGDEEDGSGQRSSEDEMDDESEEAFDGESQDLPSEEKADKPAGCQTEDMSGRYGSKGHRRKDKGLSSTE